MPAICVIDTSVFVEVLGVPGKTQQRNEILELLKWKVEANESLFLPMATILETGNHICQNGSGGARRECAQTFADQVRTALEGNSPFIPLGFLNETDLQRWINEFPDHATRGMGIGDMSIIHDWEKLCAQNDGRRVYIWSLDGHLAAYDRAPIM